MLSLQESSQNMLKVFTKFAEDVHRILPGIYIKNAHKDFLDGVPHFVVVSPGNGPKFVQDLA